MYTCSFIICRVYEYIYIHGVSGDPQLPCPQERMMKDCSSVEDALQLLEATPSVSPAFSVPRQPLLVDDCTPWKNNLDKKKRFFLRMLI